MKIPEKQNKTKMQNCPHCGQPLSPWQMVLLEVDRAIMCKNCWYRIILPHSEEKEKKQDKEGQDKENKN